MHTIEVADETSFKEENTVAVHYPFLVGYTEVGVDYTLYLNAQSDVERQEWIKSLRSGILFRMHFRAY